MPSQRTATVTGVSTRTKAVAAVGITLLAGLGAYGFGFLPMFEEESSSSDPSAACYETCQVRRQECTTYVEDPQACEPSFQECNRQCAGPSACEQQCQTTRMDCIDEGEDEAVCSPNYDACTLACRPSAPRTESPSSTPSGLPPGYVPPGALSPCLDECQYGMNKCLTYETLPVCQSEFTGCQAQCVPVSEPTREEPASTSTLRIQSSDNRRPTTILVSAGDVWQNLAEFRATADSELTIEMLGLQDFSSRNVINQVAIAQSGRILTRGVFPSGFRSTVDMDLSADPLRISAGGSPTYFQVWATLNPLVHHSVLGLESTTSTPTAAVARVGLLQNSVSGQIRLQASGATPRVGVSAPLPSGDALMGNEFIVRKTRLGITPLTISAPFRTGEMVDLYRFQMYADVAGGPAAVKKMVFNLRPSFVSGSRLELLRLRLRRGTTEIPASEVKILDPMGNDFMTSATTTLNLGIGAHYVMVLFQNEQVINGLGPVFTLQGYATGSLMTGDRVNVSFDREPAFHARLNGSLSSTVFLPRASGELLQGPHLDLGNPPGDRSLAPVPFIWSDMLSPSHSGRFGRGGGSDDWIPDHLLENLDHIEVLEAATTTSR